RIEARLLLVIERAVELLERRPHGAYRGQHGLEPLAHRLDPPRRCARQRRRARCLEGVEGLRVGVLEVVEEAALGVVRLDGLRNPLDGPARPPGGSPAEGAGFVVRGPAGGAASVAPARGAASSVPAATATRRTDRGIGPAIAERVSAEHAVNRLEG